MHALPTGPLTSSPARGYLLTVPAVIGLCGCLVGLSVAVRSGPADQAGIGFWLLLVGFFVLIILLPPALRFRHLERRAIRAASDDSGPWLFSSVAWTVGAVSSSKTPRIRRGDAGWLVVRDGRLEFWADVREVGPVLVVDVESLVEAAPVWGGGLLFPPVVRFSFENNGQLEIVDSAFVRAGWASLLGVRKRDLGDIYRLRNPDRA